MPSGNPPISKDLLTELTEFTKKRKRFIRNSGRAGKSGNYLMVWKELEIFIPVIQWRFLA
jgi:hypothetical protein